MEVKSMIRTKEYEKFNSTGTFYEHVPTNTVYSYNTPIYQEFCTRRGLLKCFNNTYYSNTTRKHQANLWGYKTQSDIIFHHCSYGNWSLDTAFRNEITMTEYELEKLQNKTHKLGKRQAERLEALKARLKELKDLYTEI